MKRILKIQERKSISGKFTVLLTVHNEAGESLQGTIIVDDINELELDLLEQKTSCDCQDEETKPVPRYFVYNPAHEGKPQKIYNDYTQALNDAKDIAKRYNRCNIYVLEIKAEVERTNFIRETITENKKLTGECNFENIPF